MAETTQAARTGRPPGGDGEQVTGQAKEKAQQAAGMAKEQTRQAAGQARDRARSEVDRRSTQAGEKVTSQANYLRSVGEELRKQGKEGPAKVADQVAERTERVGQYLTQSDGDQILDDIEDFGRRNPWVVMAGGMALGFAASRVIRASSRRRYEERVESSTSRTPAGELGRPETPSAGGA